jgi:PAS domain S-box-containing protein
MSDMPDPNDDLKKQNELLKKEIEDLKQKLDKQELSEDTREWYEILERYSREGIFLIEKGRLIQLNRMGYKMFGFDEHDHVIGTPSLDVFDDEGKKLIQKKVEEKFIGFYKVTAIKKDGTRFPVEIYGRNIMYKGREVRIAIIRDISERVETEKKLLQNEIKFKTLFEYAGDAILLGDENGFIVDMNNRFCELTGYNKEELLNEFVEKIFSKESLERKPLQFDLLKKAPLIISEREILCKDGKIIPIEMNTTLMENNYHLAIIRNLSERKKTRLELMEKNKELQLAKDKAEENDKLKSEFLANMSHEIRTPMNGILGFARMLGEDDIDKEQQKFYIDIIENSSNQLMRIIDDILEISILETKQVKIVEHPINLNRLFLELFTIYDHQAKNNKTPLYLKTGLPDDEVTIYVDDVKLRKVICNLIDNALRYTNEGYIELGYELKNDELHIRVKDTGIGIPVEKQNKIFERFSQADKHLSREYGGLGLGLSIAKENTELMGGKILVKSEEGKGSEFTLVIPYKPVNTQDDETKVKKKERAEAEVAGEDNHNLTVLIAEDEEVNFFYLTTIITRLNKKIGILHAKTGEEAVEICRNNDGIDLVLMDIKMPKLNGLDATRVIRKFRPDLNIIIQSAYSTFEDRHNALDAGCNEFLEKPINVDLLKDILKKMALKKSELNN